ncbi:MAG: AroM family protein [Gemmatimonadaceae bacterium]
MRSTSLRPRASASKSAEGVWAGQCGCLLRSRRVRSPAGTLRSHDAAPGARVVAARPLLGARSHRRCRPETTWCPFSRRTYRRGSAWLHAGCSTARRASRSKAQYEPSSHVYVSRLRDGTAVELDAERLRLGVQERVGRAGPRRPDAVIILCTGTFPGSTTSAALLIEPDRLVVASVSAMARCCVGVIAPLASQASHEESKWRGLARPPLIGVANPYARDLHALESEGGRLRAAGAELLVLDCIGYVERHRAAAQRGSGLPVLLSNALVARIVGELLDGVVAPETP